MTGKNKAAEILQARARPKEKPRNEAVKKERPRFVSAKSDFVKSREIKK